MSALPAPAQPAREVGNVMLRSGLDGFGGLSGIEVDDDGVGFLALSDRGALFEGTLERRDGTLTAARIHGGVRLLDQRGRPLTEHLSDSEGLARAPDGTLYISFERQHRVWRYDRANGPARQLVEPREFRGLQLNSGLEALAIDAQGRLLTLPERSGDLRRAFPVWRHEGKRWSKPFEIPRRGRFLPVGADFGPDGLFYLLERDFTGTGFRSRVRRFDLSGDRVGAERTLLETENGTHGNLEGIATWRDPDGAIRLVLIADNNFAWYQRNEIVEYVLPLASQGQSN